MYKILILFILLLATGCNLPNSQEELQEETLVLTQQTPTPTITTQPTRTPLPTLEEVPTSYNPPTPLPTANLNTSPQATPNNTNAAVSVSVTVAPNPPLIQPIQNEQRAVLLTTSPEGILGQGYNTLQIDIAHIAQNPANASQFSIIDTTGMLYISGLNATNAFRVEQGPYTQYPALSREENNAIALLSTWSPNGQYLAFIIHAEKNASDGVWYLEPGQFAPLQLIVDCPFEGFIGCNIVRPPDDVRFWISREIYWSPNSQTLLINAELPQRGRRGLMIRDITRNERIRDERPPMIFYDYGTWGADRRILASGRNPDGIAGVYWLNRDGSLNEIIFAQNGLWLGWAVEQPDGAIVALGRMGQPDGAVAIYDMTGTALTPPIGDGFPQRVVWSPDANAVLVEVNGRQYVATTSGLVSEISSQTGNLPVNWTQ
ncbi:MAG: hypothetical protein Kow00117_20400 [Phototrophicales bacterium]